MKRYFYYKKGGMVSMVSEKPLSEYNKERFTEKGLTVTENQISDLSKPLITKIVKNKLVFEESLQEKERELTIEKVSSARTIEDLKELLIGLIK